MVVLIPSFVFGPGNLDQSADEFARGSNAPILVHLFGKPVGPLLTISVHVDDVARSHVEALKSSVSAGKYLLDSEETDWSVARGVIKEHFPEQVGNMSPVDIETRTIKLHLDGTKAERAFGFRFKSFEEQLKDTAGYYVGLLSK